MTYFSHSSLSQPNDFICITKNWDRKFHLKVALCVTCGTVDHYIGVMSLYLQFRKLEKNANRIVETHYRFVESGGICTLIPHDVAQNLKILEYIFENYFHL